MCAKHVDELTEQNDKLRTMLGRVLSCDDLIFNSDTVLAVGSEIKNDIEDLLLEIAKAEGSV